jgi:TetR/AcrR family transcriptional regulator, cholesterol catabolism regulator
MQKYHPVSWKQFKDFKNECIMEMVVKNLYKGVEQGLYRKDMDIKVIATLRLQEVEMAMDPFVFSPGKFSIASVQLALLDHFLHGITTIKGHKLINKYKQVEEEE